jgi:sterol desaturase/sphingolipid hydroxylase (fatty acid hydroxylase superfamily)
MDQQLAFNAVLSGDSQSITDHANTEGNASPSDGHAGLYNAGDQGANAIKTMVFNHLPPLTVAVILMFWAFGPAALIKNPWTPVAVGSLTILFVLVLERIHERHAGWRMDKREFFTDLFYVILGNSVISWTSTALADDPLKAVKTSLGITTEWATHLPFLAQVVLVMFLVEFGQYWMHRLMHNNAFFWSTHAPHHHITQLNAMKGSVGNPLELFLISLSVVALFDLTPAAMFGAFNALSAISVFNHANVRSDPPIWYSFFFTTIRNHSLHHTALSYEDTRCNYGNSLILLDRIFGTYREGESSVVGQDERKRLSIWEQTIFPARSLIAMIKAKQGAASSPANG